ncbi:hypothetical protein OAP18_01285 [Gammaproteobacteria bacterium]|nr:hypothetical protein [Gammaproteobacteria bacterium]
MTSVKAGAKEILASLQYLFQGTDKAIDASEDDFPHIDFSKYRSIENTLKTDGFKKIGDIELVNISNDPTGVFRKTLIRSFVSQDNGSVVSCYELRPKWSRILLLLVRGVLALRWIAAPRFFLSMIPPRFILDIETELSDGSFVVTANAQAAGFLSGPPTVDELYLPYGTGLEKLWELHLLRLKEKIVGEVSLRAIRDKVALRKMQDRLKMEKTAHRSSSNWIKKEEIQAMCQGHSELAKLVYEELQNQIMDQSRTG